jgi:hypothetical protein
VTTDWLIFEEEEREPQDELKLKFEAVSQMTPEEQKTVRDLLDGMILKHTASRLASNQ